MMEIYTDGSALNNGNKNSIGGWSVVIVDDDNNVKKIACNNLIGVTNNQMELIALNFALLAALIYNKPTTIYVDSAYCVNMYNEWIDVWAMHNWHSSNGKEVKNLEIVKAIYKLKQLFSNSFQSLVTVAKVAGHAGIQYNELADKLAKGEILSDE